jgi:hypothetical protein
LRPSIAKKWPRSWISWKWGSTSSKIWLSTPTSLSSPSMTAQLPRNSSPSSNATRPSPKNIFTWLPSFQSSTSPSRNKYLPRPSRHQLSASAAPTLSRRRMNKREKEGLHSRMRMSFSCWDLQWLGTMWVHP